MPIYEYRCAACGHQEDHLQKLADAALTKCPACGKKKYRKQLTAAGFQLKGSGWYATDFKNSGSKPAADKSKDKSADAPAKDASAKEAPAKDSKSDSKKDTKSDTKSSAGAAVRRPTVS